MRKKARIKKYTTTKYSCYDYETNKAVDELFSRLNRDARMFNSIGLPNAYINQFMEAFATDGR